MNEKTGTLVHQGNNIRFFRTGRKLGQGALGEKIGMTQSGVAKVESRDVVEDDILERCSKALGISVDILKEFEPEKALNSISDNTFNFENSSIAFAGNDSNQQNQHYPIEKIVKLEEEKSQLYERIIRLEQANAVLQVQLENKK